MNPDDAVTVFLEQWKRHTSDKANQAKQPASSKGGIELSSPIDITINTLVSKTECYEQTHQHMHLIASNQLNNSWSWLWSVAENAVVVVNLVAMMVLKSCEALWSGFLCWL